MLNENPKLMIELAVEVTKLALNEMPQLQPNAIGAAHTTRSPMAIPDVPKDALHGISLA